MKGVKIVLDIGPMLKKECTDSEYKKAQDADIAEIRKGNYNFKGLRG